MKGGCLFCYFLSLLAIASYCFIECHVMTTSVTSKVNSKKKPSRFPSPKPAASPSKSKTHSNRIKLPSGRPTFAPTPGKPIPTEKENNNDDENGENEQDNSADDENGDETAEDDDGAEEPNENDEHDENDDVDKLGDQLDNSIDDKTAPNLGDPDGTDSTNSGDEDTVSLVPTKAPTETPSEKPSVNPTKIKHHPKHPSSVPTFSKNRSKPVPAGPKKLPPAVPSSQPSSRKEEKSTPTLSSVVERPSTDEQPNINNQPNIHEQPITDEQPTTGEQPITDEQPTTGEQPITDEQPTTGEQPKTDEQQPSHDEGTEPENVKRTSADSSVPSASPSASPPASPSASPTTSPSGSQIQSSTPSESPVEQGSSSTGDILDNPDAESDSTSGSYYGVLALLLGLCALGLAAARFNLLQRLIGSGDGMGPAYSRLPQGDRDDDEEGLQLLTSRRQRGPTTNAADDEWDDIDVSDIQQHQQRNSAAAKLEQDEDLSVAIRLSLAEAQSANISIPHSANRSQIQRSVGEDHHPDLNQKPLSSSSSGPSLPSRTSSGSGSVDSIRKKPAGKEGLGIASIPSRKDKGKEKEKEPEDLFASIGIEAHPKFVPPVNVASGKSTSISEGEAGGGWDKELDNLIDLE